MVTLLTKTAAAPGFFGSFALFLSFLFLPYTQKGFKKNYNSHLIEDDCLFRLHIKTSFTLFFFFFQMKYYRA